MSITRISPTTYRVSGSPNTLNQPWTTVVGAPGADAITLAVKPLTAQGLMDFRAATSSVVTLDVSGSWNLKVVAPATAATTLTGTLAKNISLLVDGSNTFKTDGSIDNLTVGSGVRNIIYSSALENSSLRMANPNDTLATFSTSNWLTFKDSSTGSITMYDASHASNTVTLGSVSNPYGGVINIAVDGGSSTNVSNVLDGLSITQGVGDSGHKFQTNQYMDSVYSYGDYSSYLQYGNLNNSNLDLFSQARYSNYLYTSLNSWDNNYFSKNIVLSGDGNIQIDYSYGSIDGNLMGPHGTIVLNMYSNDVGTRNNQSMVGLNSHDVINITSGATVHLDYFNGGGSIGPVSVYLVGVTGETIYATSTQYNAFTAVVGRGGSDTVRLTTEGTVVGSSSIDNYYLANGTNSFSLGAAAQNVTGGTGADTVAVGALAATGTLALAAGTNNVSLANGGSLAGATTTSAGGTWNLILANNASATVRTENLTGGAGVQLTNITAAAAESLTVNTTGAALLGYLLNTAIENWNIGTVGGENNSVNKFSLTQAVTMGAGNDFLNLTNRFGTYSGAIDLGGGTNTIFLAGGAGSYGLHDAVIQNVASVSTFGMSAGSYTLYLKESNVQNITTSILFTDGAGADTLGLNNGVYVFTGKTLTFGTAGSTLDLNLLGDDNKTVTLDAADINNVSVINGESANTKVTTLNFNDTTSLSSRTLTNVDVVTIAGTNQTLSLDGSGASGFGATQFTTVTGNTDSNLVITVDANADLTYTTISGFDTIDMTALTSNRTVTLDDASISNAAPVTLLGDATTDLTFTTDTTATNWMLTAGDFNVVTLGAGVDLDVSERFLSTTVTNVLGDLAGTETLNISGSSFGSTIDMSNIVLTTDLNSINVTVGWIGDTILTSGADATRGITRVNLSSPMIPSSDVIINNQSMDNGGTRNVSISYFDVARDQIATKINGVAATGNGFTDSSLPPAFLQTGDVGEVLTSDFVLSNLYDLLGTTGALAIVNDSFLTFMGTNNGSTIVIYDGTGSAGLYQVDAIGSGMGEFTHIELVGILNATNDSLTSTNFI